MSAAPIKLKIRSPGGDHLVSHGLTKSSTFLELKTQIEVVCGVPMNQQQLSSTYPPPVKVIRGADSDTLAALKIQSSDILLLETLSAAAAPAVSVSVSSSPPARPTSPPKPKPATLDQLQHVLPLTVRPIANDNSCLFNAIGFCMEGMTSEDLMRQLRETVAAVILGDDSDKYSEAFLGATKDVYAKQMLRSDVWGGGIELSILAEYYDIEIASLDIESGHQYLFGESESGKKKSKRIYLVYYGVHYDALIDQDAGGKRVFDPSDAVAEQRALKAALILQAKGAFTNVRKFTLRCSICNAGLTGAVEAQEHAKSTGHSNFEEYHK